VQGVRRPLPRRGAGGSTRGEPAQDNTFEGIHVIHANVTQQELTGPDGKQKPARKLVYFKGLGQMGFVEITLVDGKVYKFKK
jgi:hypothetical protein